MTSPEHPGRIAIRRATPDDAGPLAATAARIFRGTFGLDSDPGQLALHLERSFSPQIQARELTDTEVTTLVAVSDSAAIAAFAQLRTGEAAAWRAWRATSASVLFLALCVGCRDPRAETGPHPRTWVEESTGMAFVRIVPGSFTMGSPSDELGREAQEVAHAVAISRTFWLGRTEVTQAEWATVMGSNPSHFADRGGTHPVERVTWHDVQAFLRRLEQRAPGSRFRLPTEAEWEYACRAGSRTPYATGDTLGPTDANVTVVERIAGASAHVVRRGTVPVASFAPNGWGLFDMHGNVWEWTADAHCPYPTGAAIDPTSTCDTPLKVIRGGSWYFEADSARCALRYTHHPQDLGFSLGFRVVREAD